MQNIRGKQFPAPKSAVCSIFLFVALNWNGQKESLVETDFSFCNALLRDYVFLAKDISSLMHCSNWRPIYCNLSCITIVC